MCTAMITMSKMKSKHIPQRNFNGKPRKNTQRLAFLFLVLYLPVIYVTTGADPSPRATAPVQMLIGYGKPLTRVVSTKYGDLQGFVHTLPSRPAKPVEVFLGIPYASPPIASLRFMPPVTPAHWRGTRPANKFSPVCPQKPPDIRNETEALKTMPFGRLQFLKRLLPYLQNQSEDCLYLNIYAPKNDS